MSSDPERVAPPRWVHDLDPQPDWAISVPAERDGWQIEARWWGMADGSGRTEGPREVVIRPAPGIAPDVLRRGIGAGVMRRLEQSLTRMIADVTSPQRGGRATTPPTHEAAGLSAADVEAAGLSAADVERVYREALADRARALPVGGPRGAPDYYPALLDLFEWAEVMSTQPIRDMAEAMGANAETVKTRLRVARQRAEGRAADGTPTDDPR